MKTNYISQVKQAQIIRIAMLVSLLVSLPKTVFIYNMVETGKMDFSDVSIAEFFIQFLLFFLFSWLIIQLCANWAYQFFADPTIRIVTSLILGICSTVGFIYVLEIAYPVFTGNSMNEKALGILKLNYVVIFIVLFFVARILRLQLVQKENLLENEQLKQQNLRNELAALRSQIDPHFLFNSLNSLNSLIRDNKEATSFVTKLSFMYRYILQSSDRDLVSVREELKFLESYIYLIKTRYRDRFSIKMDIDVVHLEKEVPPLALQVLVENAVKHNEISESYPLEVTVYVKDNSICVENTVRPRTTLAEGTGNGLSNLDKRYALLGQQKMKISTKNNTFCVKIPLLDKA